MKAGAVASIIAAIISTGGAFGGYMYFRPNNLKSYFEWKGLSLASVEDEDLWKAIYEDHKDDFDKEFDGKANPDKWKVIRDYCTKAFKKSDYSPEINKATKWCLDDVKTVGGQLVRNKVDLNSFMKDNKGQYRVAAAVQGNEKFWDLLGANGADLDKKAEEYEKWCKNSMRETPKTSLVENVNRFCKPKPYSNFQGKLKAEGYVRFQKTEIYDKYKQEFGKLKNWKDSQILQIIVAENQELAEKFKIEGDVGMMREDSFVEAYEAYCNKAEKKDFSANNYSELYPKYKGICAKEDPDKDKSS